MGDKGERDMEQTTKRNGVNQGMTAGLQINERAKVVSGAAGDGGARQAHALGNAHACVLSVAVVAAGAGRDLGVEQRQSHALGRHRGHLERHLLQPGKPVASQHTTNKKPKLKN